MPVVTYSIRAECVYLQLILAETRDNANVWMRSRPEHINVQLAGHFA